MINKNILPFGTKFEGQTKDAGFESGDHPTSFETYQGWEIGDVELILPAHCRLKLISAGNQRCCATLQVVKI